MCIRVIRRLGLCQISLSHQEYYFPSSDSISRRQIPKVINTSARMSSKPHSKTVRGTFDNPKTKEAINSDKKPPQLGDPTSLKPENSSKELPANDSAPPGGESNDSGANVGAPTPSNPSGELPHSKKVRGTLANKDGKKVNKSQLGDPASLKAETSKTEMDKSTEREGSDKSGKSKL
jgi:hypothetical protein